MAQLQCECGIRLSNCLYPNILQGTITGDFSFRNRDIWECHKCGRLAIDVKDDDGQVYVKWYLPEDGEIGNLFSITDSSTVITELKESIKIFNDKLKLYEDLTNGI